MRSRLALRLCIALEGGREEGWRPATFRPHFFGLRSRGKSIGRLLSFTVEKKKKKVRPASASLDFRSEGTFSPPRKDDFGEGVGGARGGGVGACPSSGPWISTS
jgi:hypothetical protein